MQYTIQRVTFVAVSVVIIGAFAQILWDPYQGEREGSSTAMQAFAQLNEAVVEKDEAVLNVLLAENIVLKAVSGSKSSERVLSRAELVAKLAQNEIKSYDPIHPRLRPREEKVDVQVFLRTTFHSEAGNIHHRAEHIFTFAREAGVWKLIEITRDDSPITFWQAIRYSPDLVIRNVLESLH